MPSVVILTAIRAEYKAVRAHLTNLQEETHPQGTIYERGKFTSNGKSWEVGIVEIGTGNSAASMEAERAIAYFKPSIVLFVGVAGGIKDVKLGDVVAATKVYGYESGKAELTLKPRPDVGLSAYNMIQRAKAEARKPDWQQRLTSSPNPSPNVFVAPIAAGEKVVASTQSSVWQFLRDNYGDVVAVEMEGRGLLQATHANQQVSALIIRGISDLIDGKSKADAAGLQETAASHASAFAFEILAKHEPTELNSSPQELEPNENNLLCEALLSLNYRDQVEKFEKFWEADTSRQVGSFLVWGKAASCQGWLLNRLLHKSFHDTTTANKIRVFLSDRESYIDELWRKLSKELKTSYAPQKLIERMYEYWQNENVIIVLHNLERMCPTEPKQLIEKFCNPLVERVQTHPGSCSSYLVMFLVDNKGCAPKWKIDFATDINKWETSQPFDLQQISNFSDGLLNTWVQKNRQLPNFPQNNKELKVLAKNFWDDSRDGIPELVMNQICEHCNSSWSNISKLLEV